MTMTIKKICLLLFITTTLCVSGCSSLGARSEQEIMTSAKGNCIFTERNMIIDDMKIYKRQSNIKEKEDLVYIKVNTHNEMVVSEESYLFRYIYDNKGGWVCESADPVYDNPWVSRPVKGVSDDTIQNDLLNNSLNKDNIEAYNLTINPKKGLDRIIDMKELYKCILFSQYDSHEIVEKNTQLDLKQDTIKVSLKRNTDLFEISSMVTLIYNFDDNSSMWKLSRFSGFENSISWKPGKWYCEYTLGANPRVYGYELKINSMDTLDKLNGTLSLLNKKDGAWTSQAYGISNIASFRNRYLSTLDIILYLDDKAANNHVKTHYLLIDFDKGKISLAPQALAGGPDPSFGVILKKIE